MMGSRPRSRSNINVWPGYVDALSALLMLVIFMLLVYVVSQLYLSQTLSDRNAELAQLNNRLAEISLQLGLEKERSTALETEMAAVQNDYSVSLARGERLQDEVAQLVAKVSADREQIQVLLGTQASLQQDIVALRELREKLEQDVAGLTSSLDARDEDVASLDQQLGALRDRSQALQAELADERERTLLSQQAIDTKDIRIQDLVAIVEEGEQALDNEQQLTASQRAQINRLSDQIAALQDQLNQINAALRLQEGLTATKDAELAELGRRLNTLLAQRVNELERYQSEFFGRLRDILKANENVRIVGDRFLLPSELLFASGSARLGQSGQAELDKLAGVLLDVVATIPKDIDWILRIDGHTDRVPINTLAFPSNWELSTARAVAVVRYLADQGVPENRMAAAGFGEFFPVATGSSEQALQQNRRIEIKLTDR